MKRDEEEFSEAQQVASLIAGTGEQSTFGQAKAISYRIPVWLLEDVDAMAAQAGKSRNAMLSLVLGVGIQEIQKQLSDEVSEALVQRKAEVHEAVMQGADENVRE